VEAEGRTEEGGGGLAGEGAEEGGGVAVGVKVRFFSNLWYTFLFLHCLQFSFFFLDDFIIYKKMIFI